MNFIAFIQWLQDFRSQLEEWGVTTESLIAAGLIAFLFFLLSAREVAGWFLKTGGLRREIGDLRREIASLRESVEQLRAPAETPKAEDAPEKISASKTGSETPGPRAFRLDH